MTPEIRGRLAWLCRDLMQRRHWLRVPDRRRAWQCRERFSAVIQTDVRGRRDRSRQCRARCLQYMEKKTVRSQAGPHGRWFPEVQNEGGERGRPGIELNFRHARLDIRATRFFVNRENFFERRLSVQNRDGLGFVILARHGEVIPRENQERKCKQSRSRAASNSVKFQLDRLFRKPPRRAAS